MRQPLHLADGTQGAAWLGRGPASGVESLHSHPEVEVNLVTGGTARYLVGGSSVDLGPDDLVWLLPHQDHGLTARSPDFGLWVAVFRPGALRRAGVGGRLADPSPDDDRPWTARLPRPVAARLRQLLAEVAELGPPPRQVGGGLPPSRSSTSKPELRPGQRPAGEGRRGPGQRPAGEDDAKLLNAALGYLAVRAWLACVGAAHTPATRPLHPSVRQAAHALWQEPAGLDRQALAHLVGLSPGRLSRLFNEQIGTSLADYRRRVMLARVVELRARGGGGNLTSLAYAAGFGSYASFHRAHVQILGEPPSARMRAR
ncbi:MAG: helix-turn-helix domain-containing protein [Acidimicrobiales bacterium]